VVVSDVLDLGSRGKANSAHFHFIYGTVVTSTIALVLAVPLGVGAAIFLAELAPTRISNALTFLIELLAAVPSVIFGLLGIFILVPALVKIEPAIRAVLGWTPLFSGTILRSEHVFRSVVVTVMIIPFIISISREVILAVPTEQREGALALGATRWETTWDVVIPFARTGNHGFDFSCARPFSRRNDGSDHGDRQ